MRIGSKMYVTAIEQEKFKIMHSDNSVICQVRTSRTAIVDEIDEDEDEEGVEGEEGAEAPAEGAAKPAAAPKK